MSKKNILNNINFENFISQQENRYCNKFDPEKVILSDINRQSSSIYSAIGYPSKVFHDNIRQYIKLYTKKGGVVLDSLCGSGSTGIAALLEERKAILFDNSPQAINLAFNTLNPVDINTVEKTFTKLKNDLKNLINGIYRTISQNGLEGYADVIMTSNIYSCPKCNHDIILYYSPTGKRSEYKCSHCNHIINISTKEDKERIIGKRIPVEVTINITEKTSGKKTEKRAITKDDQIIWEEALKSYEEKYGHLWSPAKKIVYNRCYPRIGGWPGFPIDSTVSDLFPKKNLIALKLLHHYIESEIVDEDIRSFFMLVFTESLFRTSKRLFSTSGIKNVYHVPPVGREQNVFTVFERKFKKILAAKTSLQEQLPSELVNNNLRVVKQNAKQLPLKNDYIDYAFIDPPYGGMVPYAELNLFYSAWLKEKEDLDNEIIIPMDYERKPEYVSIWGKQLEDAFREVYRVLKPGAYFTVVFQSKFNNIWNELRDLMINRIGFEFVNILSNERSTTFHTNQLNDTNPQSAFITYKKPVLGTHTQRNNVQLNIFDIFPLDYLTSYRTFREIQSKMINLAHEYYIDSIPSDKEIESWLNSICTKATSK